MNIFYLISKMSCNKSGSRRVPIQHYLMKNIGIQRKIYEYLLFDQQNVLQQIWQPESTNTALFDEKKLESKEKSTHIVYLISKMSCNKSGSRRVPIQHYLMKNIGTDKKFNEYLLFDQQNVLQQIWQPETTNTALFDEKIGIERKINEYLLFDQQNVLQQIWQPERTNTAIFWKFLESKEKSTNILYLMLAAGGSTNTAIFWKLLESKEKSMNIFCLISTMSCNKSGSRRVPIQQYFGNFWNRKKNQ